MVTKKNRVDTLYPILLSEVSPGSFTEEIECLERDRDCVLLQFSVLSLVIDELPVFT